MDLHLHRVHFLVVILLLFAVSMLVLVNHPASIAYPLSAQTLVDWRHGGHLACKKTASGIPKCAHLKDFGRPGLTLCDLQKNRN